MRKMTVLNGKNARGVFFQFCSMKSEISFFKNLFKDIKYLSRVKLYDLLKIFKSLSFFFKES